MRLALYEVWKSKCSWCDEPVDFNGLQIDHILPRTASTTRLAELVSQLSGRPRGDYDVHDPYNLAPICSTCNRRKKDLDLTSVPLVVTILDRAYTLRAIVIEKVEAFPTSGNVAKGLVTAIEADIDNPAARAALDEHAPRLIQKVALMDPSMADSYLITRRVRLEDPDRQSPSHVRLTLDSGGRNAISFLEHVCGGSLERLLVNPLLSLEEQLIEANQTQLEQIDIPGGVPTAGTPTATIDVVIDTVRLVRQGTTFEFAFWGRFDADLDAPVIVPTDDGSGTVEEQGYDLVNGTFSFGVWWAVTDDVFETGDCLVAVLHSAPEILGVRGSSDWLTDDID